MGFADYDKRYVVINGTTNEHIKVPSSPVKTIVLKDFKIDEIMLIEVVLSELKDCDCVTISKSYMKDD